jgi:hypothetical protein
MNLEVIAIETIGWIGAALILTAYALISSGKIQARTLPYQWMNVIGAAAFIVNSGWNGAYPSAVLNVIWVGIGVVTLMKMRSAGKPQDKSGA